MARRLVQAGHEVHMVSSDWRATDPSGRHWEETVEAGIRVYRLTLPYSNKMVYGDRLKAFFRFAALATVKARRIECDIVFATSTPLTIAIPAVRAAKKNRCPLVFEVRDLWPEAPISVGALKNPLAIAAARWLERFAYRHSSHIVALSPGMKEGVVSTGYPQNQVTVIPNACDLADFNVGTKPGEKLRREFAWLADRPLIVYTGTLGTVNGVDYLVRVAAAANKIDPEIRFALLGTGKEETAVRSIAAQEGVLDKNLFMMGSVPKRQIPHWLSAATIATSMFVDNKIIWSNSANKFFDALAAGKPIAINYGGWQADLLKESGAGLVLDPHDTEAAAASLVGAARDRDWLTHSGQAAIELAKERFDRDRLAGQLEQILARSAG